MDAHAHADRASALTCQMAFSPTRPRSPSLRGSSHPYYTSKPHGAAPSSRVFLRNPSSPPREDRQQTSHSATGEVPVPEYAPPSISLATPFLLVTPGQTALGPCSMHREPPRVAGPTRWKNGKFRKSEVSQSSQEFDVDRVDRGTRCRKRCGPVLPVELERDPAHRLSDGLALFGKSRRSTPLSAHPVAVRSGVRC